MTRLLLALLVGAALLAPALPATAAEEYTIEGSGWGHGVGFSQYGARGQAIEDPAKSGEDIAAYYYTGAQPASLADLTLSDGYLLTGERPLWVGLAQNVEVLEFTPLDGPVTLCVGGDCTAQPVPAAGEVWTYQTVGSGCAWFHSGVQQGAEATCAASISWPAAAGVEVRDLTNTPLICGSVARLARCQYRRGQLELRADPGGSGFHVVLAIGLEEYLYGLRELPDDWTRPNVNQAQAVAARSYAAVEFLSREDAGGRTATDAGLSASQQDACWCHTYDDTRDQYYVGYDKEVGAPQWVEAVDATAGRVLTYFGPDWEWSTAGGILQGFYSSSPGAWTESNTTGFGSSVQYPYLYPVPDPWSLDPAAGNPYASWSETFTADELALLLGVDEVTGVNLERAAPGAVVAFETIDHGESGVVHLSGSTLRSTLGLRSASITAVNGVGAGPAPIFDDIAGSVHEGAIEAIYAAGITYGCDADSFCINDDVLRGQMASFIARAMNLPAPLSDYASDDASSVHEDNINRIYDAAIPVECGDGLYCPGEAITREHMAVFLYRALALPDADDDVFSDDEQSPYEREINALAAAGITVGCADGSFCPDEPVSRGQMASFLARAFLGGLTQGG